MNESAVFGLATLVPVELLHLRDAIDSMVSADAFHWAAYFQDAAQPGADLSSVRSAWLDWMLTDAEHGVIRHAHDQSEVRDAIEQVAELIRRGASRQEFEAVAVKARDANSKANAAGARAAAVAAQAAEAVAEANDSEAAEMAQLAAEEAAAASAASPRTHLEASEAARRTWIRVASDKLIQLAGSAPQRSPRPGDRPDEVPVQMLDTIDPAGELFNP